MASRKTSIFVALISALLAGGLIYMFVSHYHKTTVDPPATTTVFVAKHFIPAGTPETTIASDAMLKPKVIAVAQVVAGAITDPSVITGEVAAAPIAPGQQVTVTDFSHTDITLSSYLQGDHRAVAMSIDPAHGLTSYLTVGNTVDVMAQGPKGSFDLFQNVTVLANAAGDVVLDLTDKQSLLLANALEANLTLWLELRPVTGARNSVPNGHMVKL
jgi:Flp pilus assembly protein CpaB